MPNRLGVQRRVSWNLHRVPQNPDVIWSDQIDSKPTSWMQASGFLIANHGSWIQDPGSWIPHPGSWVLEHSHSQPLNSRPSAAHLHPTATAQPLTATCSNPQQPTTTHSNSQPPTATHSHSTAIHLRSTQQPLTATHSNSPQLTATRNLLGPQSH